MLRRLDEIENYLKYVRRRISEDKENLGLDPPQTTHVYDNNNNGAILNDTHDKTSAGDDAHVSYLINTGNCELETDGFVSSCEEATTIVAPPVYYRSVRLNRPTEEELLKWDLFRHQEDLPKPWTYFKLDKNKGVFRPPDNIRDDFYNGDEFQTKQNNKHMQNIAKDKIMNNNNINNNNFNKNNNNNLNKVDPKTNPWKAREGNEIDQWVTDAFYSYFPSLNETRSQKKLKLARDRQHDYNEFVKQIPAPVPKREQLRQKREQYLNQVKRSELTSASSNEGSSSPVSSGIRPSTPKHRLMQDLTHVDLPAMLQTDAIEQRERKSAEEEAEKRAIYQQELLRQIEEKKRNLEKLRKQQEEEEYRVTRELENQLLTLQLEEELAKQGKKLARTRAVANRDTLRRQTLLTNLMQDKNIAGDAIDKAMNKNLIDFSESPKPPLPQNRDEKIYTYFTNSAKVDKQLANSSGASSSSSTADDLLVLPHINRYQYCKKCRHDIDDSFFNFTSAQTDTNANRIKSCFHCHILDHKLSDKLCEDCNTKFKKLSNACKKCENSKESCEFCNKNDFNYCPFCTDRHEPMKQDLNNNLAPEQIFNNVSVVPMPKRYIDEQNRLPKFINNENESNVKRAALKPLVLPKTAGVVHELKLPRKSGSFKRLEGKWEVPAVRRFSMHQTTENEAGHIETFTEVGAFKKQLQAEMLKETTSE